MGNRLSKIVTRTGDTGMTGLGDGSRVSKSAPRIEALGAVDELNCALGLLLTANLDAPHRTLLTAVQHALFDLGGELSIPTHRMLSAERVALLDEAIATLNATLPPLREFVLPGGTAEAAQAHMARTIARRAERRLAGLAQTEDVSPLAIQYLNRLSDLLFVLARILNRERGVADVCWTREGGGA